MDRRGIEPLIFGMQNRRSAAELPALEILVGNDGVEPSASSLSERRSTDELVAQDFILAFCQPYFKPIALISS